MATRATAGHLAEHPRDPAAVRDGLVDGFSSAYGIASVLLAIAVAWLMNTPRLSGSYGVRGHSRPGPKSEQAETAHMA